MNKPKVNECSCDDYKWLDEQLGGMAVFLWAHGQEIKENRGPFKFCPYCGKRTHKAGVEVEEAAHD
jgi:NADH pyrophosphatase NudC (nudix superfamily)